MSFKKGQSGNPNGRPKGAKDKVNTTIKEWVMELLNGNRGQIQKDLKKLSAKDRVNALLGLLPYILPKMQSINADINMDSLSDNQISEITENILITMGDESTVDQKRQD